MNIEYCEAKSNDAKEIIHYLNIVAGQTDNLNYGNNEINFRKWNLFKKCMKMIIQS